MLQFCVLIMANDLYVVIIYTYIYVACSCFTCLISSYFLWKGSMMTLVICFRKEMSAYYLEHASVDHIHNHFDLFEAEARRLLDLGLAIPAYFSLLYSTFMPCNKFRNLLFFWGCSWHTSPYFSVMLGMISFWRHLMPSMFWILEDLLG